MWKWARRSRRLALIMVVDGLLVLVVVVGLLVLLLRSGASNPSETVTPVSPPETVLPAVGFDALTPSPAPPTINPTRLAGVPNQGQSEAPSPPPGLLAKNTVASGSNALPRPTATPTASPRP